MHFSHKDLKGEDAFTKSQMKKMAEAYEKGRGVTIKMSKSQLKHNMNIEGSFLEALSCLAAKFLPWFLKKVLPA